MLTFMQDKPELARKLLLPVIDDNNKRKAAEQRHIDDASEELHDIRQRYEAVKAVRRNALAAGDVWPPL